MVIRCYSCQKEKAESEFNWSRKADGVRQSMCRACFSEYNRVRYQADPDSVKKRVAAYREEHPDIALETRLSTCQKNPTHRNAYRVVEAAIKAGRLERGASCGGCGRKAPEARIHAHHANYSEPLNVVWVCPRCHHYLDKLRRIQELEVG